MRLAYKATTSVAIVGALLTLGIPVASSTTSGSTGAEQTYLVMYKNGASSAGAESAIADAGGAMVVNHREVGLVVATSDQTDFASAMESKSGVEEVAVSETPIAQVNPVSTDSHDQPSEMPNSPATPDNLAALQWDMRQIHAFEAHAITGGSPTVVVGDIDTGLDFTHPDLAPNYDAANSADCESGAPLPLEPGNDANGHGTHTAGTIAAADNGIGITGVAPNVRIAGIKSSLDSGYFFVEMVVCSFLWAGGAGFDMPAGQPDVPATDGPRVDVTNNSYYMDPFLYNCRNDAEQRVLWKAAQRAAMFATQQGVTHVASQGNDSDDRAHPTYDASSPDYPPGTAIERDITNACVVVPLELPGVVGVTAVGNTRQVDGNDDPNDYLKSYYSAYGVGVAEVTAPGGDFFYGRGTEGQPFGLVLSTWPDPAGCGRAVTEDPPPAAGGGKYCYLQGTSMAGPHAAGVAALIISRFGDLDSPQNGKMRPGSVAAYMQQTADAQPCPTELPLTGAPGSTRANTPYANTTRPDGSPQECQGGESYNSWYGSGQINALRAVTHDAGQ
jgi:subtilisin family serine protease